MASVPNENSDQSMRGSRGGNRGSGYPPPEKSQKNAGFLSNTGPDPLKNHKATKPDSMWRRHRHASETPFKWRFAGPVIELFGLSHKKQNKKRCKVGPSLTKLSGSAHAA